MTISTEKLKTSSQRFLLARLNPARYIAPVLNGSVYEITLPFIVNTVSRNGVALTKDLTTPTVNDHWYQDEQTKLLKVKLASAPSATTNVIVCNYYLFYTGTIFRAISENPEDDATAIREWTPRIENYPSVLQSFDNIFNGVFSVNDTSIVLINNDSEFQTYLTDDDTFYNKQVDMWICINNVGNIQKVFTGTIKKIEIAQNTVSINAVDSFNKLKSTAFMGDETSECYLGTEDFPNVFPLFKDFPIPFIVGDESRWTSRIVDQPGSIKSYAIEDANKAACTTTTTIIANTNNRTWSCCRQKGAVNTQSFGTISGSPAFVTIGPNTFWFLNLTTTSNVSVGDTIKWAEGGTHYALVGHVGSFTYLSNPYNLIVWVTDGSTFTGSSTITNLKSFAVVARDNAALVTYYPCYERDYTVTETSTSGGNKYVEIVFVNNFESAIGSGTLDPFKWDVSYRTSNADATKHADFLEDVCTLVGIPVNSSTFTTANTDLNVKCQFSIPNFDEQDYDTYVKYCQDVLGSTLGYLRINDDFEAEYKLIEAPTSTDVRDNALMLQDNSNCTVEYQDIQTKIISYNPHNSSQWAAEQASTPSETRENVKAKYLHGLDNTVRFRHVLKTITDRIDNHMAFKSEPFVKYSFKTATQDLDSNLGDDVQLENRIVLGTNSTQDVKIITIEKSPQSTFIEASDFRGF